jgi:predicted nucleic acid-binding protein
MLQEIIRRFTAIDKREAIGPAFQIVLDIAVMERYGIRWILSFDVDFDRWPGLERIYRV